MDFGSSQNGWTPLKVIMVALVAIFGVQAVMEVWLGNHFIANAFSLTMEGLKAGEIWRLFSYAFLHDGLWHMLFNVLALYFIGTSLERELGGRALAVICAMLALAGGLAFSLVHSADQASVALVGASAVAIGLLTIFCLSYPDRPITLLLFFIIPVTLKPKYVLYFTLALNCFGFFFGEIAPGGSVAGAVGYSAHLGGMLAAWAVTRWCLKTSYGAESRRFQIETPQWVKSKTVVNKAVTPNYQVNLSSREALQKEVDRILDKINTQGFGALTNAERKTLDKARDILGK